MRSACVSICTCALLASAWWGSQTETVRRTEKWQEVAPGILRSSGSPAGYAILSDHQALLVGAAAGMDLAALKQHGVTRVEECWLTHHHRDSTAQAAEFIKQGIRVRAAKGSEEWLGPEGVQKFWATSLPVVPPDREPVLKDRSLGVFAYQMAPQGIAGIEFNLEPSQSIEWRGWQVEVLNAPGHSRDHVAYLARQPDAQAPVVFCGDAFCSSGKMWTPYTLDWDHWNDLGLKAAAASLRTIASKKPALLCPEHGPVLSGTEAIATALDITAKRLDEAGFLKSYERFTKERLRDPPQYEFLAKGQVATAGEQPWSRLSEHLFLTGNTYVLSSRTGNLMVVDPYGPGIAQQISQLQRTEKLGPVEVVVITHAHNDHYTGAFLLPERNKWQVWTLDAVARPIQRPFSVCAPYVDTRALEVDRILKDDETINWHEYQFQISHFPGQTLFTMGLQTKIDDRSCFFTGDNFFHADQFSGSGGWSGRNRAWPLLYSQSAQRVLDAAPDWVLAEHGGAFVFSADDFRRRVQWGQATARVMDELSSSAQHRHDWNPTRIAVEPMLQRPDAQGRLSGEIVLENPLGRPVELHIELHDRGQLTRLQQDYRLAAGQSLRQPLLLSTVKGLPRGRHVFTFTVRDQQNSDPVDLFMVVESD